MDAAVKTRGARAASTTTTCDDGAGPRGRHHHGESLARTFWQWLEPVLPAGRLRRVAVVETEKNASSTAVRQPR